ncbi:DUF2254 domain-containing protein [Archangium violaceum]|uniref:DUF2254 domain-containing protein n=1 Tax=Archangium violaceum Cb vi76 TaxID=1406225 RepID=A0A084SEC8_9BACT|nr:DUF2254 domain-containing protein [Archangium violaceum]KFA86813.1 hypothetical protein Q664_51400 [Archangium violaceum Cb vi76]
MRGTQAQARMEAGLAAPRRARPGEVHPIRWWVRRRVWLPPVLAALAGACLGILFVEYPSPMARVLRGVAWQATAAEARNMLSTVLGITLTSLSIVLSLSMLVVQNAAGQYSPRLLRLFLHSAGIRVVIPMFVATSVFCLVAAQEFGFVSGTGRAPRPALGLAMLLLVACEGALVFQVLHTLQIMRVEKLVRWIRRETLRVARTQERFRRWDADMPAVVPARPEGAWPLRAPANGFIVAVDERALLAAATARGLVVHVSHAIGEPVIQGAEVGWVEATGHASPASRAASEALLTRAILLDRWRDEDADVALGVRQLVDVAIKALSPGINDPYTAVEVVDQLTFLLCELSRLHLGPRVLEDEAGSARVFLHALALRDYLELATDQILRYGASEPAVVLRLLRMAGAVGQRARSAEDRRAARETLHRLLAEAERAQAGAPWLEPLRRHAETLERARAGGWLPPLPAHAF